MSDHRFYHVSPAGKLVRVGTPEEGLVAAAQKKGLSLAGLLPAHLGRAGGPHRAPGKEVDLFIETNFLVTVNKRAEQDSCLLSRIERLVERDIESARQGPAFLMHVILDHIGDQKFLVAMVLLGITSYFLLRRLERPGSAPGGKR
jgi:hypothetical protein